MIRYFRYTGFCFLILLTAWSCIDPYVPKLSGFKPVLVVDGLITNANRSYLVKLSESVQVKDSTPFKISDATVWITDDAGVRTNLANQGNGQYKTDSLIFTGEVGKKYQLHIIKADGSEYASDSCKMLPVPDIDTVYFLKDTRLYDNQTIIRPGISIYIDSKEPPEDQYYLRWTFDETWRYKIPYPTKYNYLNDSTILLLPASQVKEFCYRGSSNTEVLTSEIQPGTTGSLKGIPMTFIASELSSRLLIRYSIIIHQYSISHQEYKYWNNLKTVGETEGDLFGSQPFAIVANVRNVRDPNEMVLGYFQVSAVSEKRIFIDYMKDIMPLNLPTYRYQCKLISMSPQDYQYASSWVKLMTWDKLYDMFTQNGYVFVAPYYDPVKNNLQKLMFSTPECANCELTGTSGRPYFWTDK